MCPRTHTHTHTPQVPRWRDWLLDVLCYGDIDTGPSAAAAAGPAGGVPLQQGQGAEDARLAATREAAIDALTGAVCCRGWPVQQAVVAVASLGQ